MFSEVSILAIFITYLLLLFSVAIWVEQKERSGVNLANNAYVYALSLAIYCTAWTYYGSVGKATNSGLLFLAVYLGPTLIVALWWIILRKMIRIRNIYKITSLADLIATRYDKSLLIGSFVSIIALLGTVPYISIQIKSIISSFHILTSSQQTTDSFISLNVGYIVVFVMIVFTIIFGLRKLDPTERHQGMMVIVAMESFIKLIAIITVGVFVTFFLFDGFADILEKAETKEFFKGVTNSENSSYATWISILILSMSAVMFLPRQFHASVIENSDEKHIAKAMWMFPLYLFLITLFTLPIAMGGLLLGFDSSLGDVFVLNIPFENNSPILSIVAFIGGFSAATSMIMITSMTMAIMISNYLVLPIIESFKPLNFLKKHILVARWIIVALFISSGYIFYIINSTQNRLLVNVGLISFVAILQFAPIIIGGLFWKHGNKKGALTGLLLGFGVWFYTLIIPEFALIGVLDDAIVTFGAFGIGFLKPHALFGLEGFGWLSNSVFWSMFFNISGYVIVSHLSRQSTTEERIANDFINALKEVKQDISYEHLEENISLEKKLLFTDKLLCNYFSKKKAKIIIEETLTLLDLKEKDLINISQLANFNAEIEKKLAGTIGSAGAHIAIKKSNIFTEKEIKELSNVYSEMLAQLKVSPEEFTNKLNFYKEKEKLLHEHSDELIKKIVERDSEINKRREVEKELQLLNEELENRVIKRTEQLQIANNELEKYIHELKNAQKQLIQSEKMASLGELVAGVAHEINTPVGISLTGITHIEEKIREINQLYKAEDMSQEEFESFLEISEKLSKSITINLRKASELIKSFKQVSIDRANDDERVFNMCEYIEEILISVHNVTKKRDVEIKVTCPNDLNVKTSPGAISQILTNFIMNSLIHGIKKEKHGLISISVAQKEEKLELTFKDNGEGIKQDILEKIYQPFFTTNREHGGSGLGLNIVYNIVTSQLKGEIHCQSKEGEGTTFRVVF